jgi:hypothetical protein
MDMPAAAAAAALPPAGCRCCGCWAAAASSCWSCRCCTHRCRVQLRRSACVASMRAQLCLCVPSALLMSRAAAGGCAHPPCPTRAHPRAQPPTHQHGGASSAPRRVAAARTACVCRWRRQELRESGSSRGGVRDSSGSSGTRQRQHRQHRQHCRAARSSSRRSTRRDTGPQRPAAAGIGCHASKQQRRRRRQLSCAAAAAPRAGRGARGVHGP